jgi:hypothetical protein
MTSMSPPLRSTPALSRLRRNHALEHATIHVLVARHPRRTLIGRSDFKGFFLYGDLPTDEVAQAAGEALDRLNAGERRLALHPNCGTNLLTAGVLAGGAAFLASAGRRPPRRWSDRLLRLPSAVLAATLGVVLAQPLGMAVQRRYTTDPDPAGLRLVGVRRLSSGTLTLHRILTDG